MKLWLAVAVVGLGLCIWIMLQNDRIDSLKRETERLESIVEGHKAQRENDKRFDDLSRELQNGGEDSLSDYMRGTAGKLWP